MVKDRRQGREALWNSRIREREERLTDEIGAEIRRVKVKEIRQESPPLLVRFSILQGRYLQWGIEEEMRLGIWGC